MMKQHMRVKGFLLSAVIGVSFLMLLNGCAETQVKDKAAKAAPAPPTFMPVIAQPGDTLTSLASRYLKDPGKSWQIAEFNNITSVTPGQELVIPLRPYAIGGIGKDSYQTIPVLSYHNFSKNKTTKMIITRAEFEKQMKLLKDNGYRVIGMDELFEFLNFRTQLPKKSVVITIDDGWRATYDIAYPVLKKYGFPATLMVYTDLITNRKQTLSWDLIKEMADNGIGIQGHTKTHRDLTSQKTGEPFKAYIEDIDHEIVKSTKIIKEKLGRDVKYLAYPYGKTNHLVIALLKKHGYAGAFTVNRGGNPSFAGPFVVRRSMIYGDMSLKQFEKNLVISSRKALR